MSLYDINEAIEGCVDTETGEIIDEAALTALQMEKKQKVRNIACWVKNLLADAESYKKEKEAFAARQKAAEAKAESLKRYLSSACAGEKYNEPEFSIKWRASKQVIVDAGAKLPYEFMVWKDPQPDKTKLKKAIESGAVFDGVELIEKQNIQIG